MFPVAQIIRKAPLTPKGTLRGPTGGTWRAYTSVWAGRVHCAQAWRCSVLSITCEKSQYRTSCRNCSKSQLAINASCGMHSIPFSFAIHSIPFATSPRFEL
eukprot:7929761-Pyramimonas_sp.AAC.2